MPLKVNELYETSFLVSSAPSTNSIAKRSSIKQNTMTGAGAVYSVVNKATKSSEIVIDATYSHLGAIAESAESDQSYSTLNRGGNDHIANTSASSQANQVPTYEIVDDEDFAAGSNSASGPRNTGPNDAGSAYNTRSNEPAQPQVQSSATYSTLDRRASDDVEILAEPDYANGVLTTPDDALLVMQEGNTGVYNMLSNDRESNTASALYSTLDRTTSPPDAGLYSIMQSLSPAANPITQQYDHIYLGEDANVYEISVLPSETDGVNGNSQPFLPLPANSAVLMQSYEQTTLRGFEFAPDEDL